MMTVETLAARYGGRMRVTFGALRFVCISVRRGDNNRVYGDFACECGRTVSLPAGRVFNGKRTHCGCRSSKAHNLKHGMRGSPEYSSWQAMKTRCLNPKSRDYARWGAQGITICPEWIESFEAFYQHVGPRRPGTSLDRIDNNEGYRPGNVRWATKSEQQQNRGAAYRWHIKGMVFESHSEAADWFGVSRHTVWRWVNGQQDRRRNSFTQPREDCYVIPRY